MSSCAGDNVDSRREPAVHAPSALRGKRGLQEGLTFTWWAIRARKFYHATCVCNACMLRLNQRQSINIVLSWKSPLYSKLPLLSTATGLLDHPYINISLQSSFVRSVMYYHTTFRITYSHTCVTESSIQGFRVMPQGQGEARPSRRSTIGVCLSEMNRAWSERPTSPEYIPEVKDIRP